MSKKQPSPYAHYDDAQLLARYSKLCQDDEKFYWFGFAPNYDRNKRIALLDKIDKLIAECITRGLMKDTSEALTQKAIDLNPWEQCEEINEFWPYSERPEIQKSAYFRWIDEGQPEGKEKEHWLSAQHELFQKRRRLLIELQNEVYVRLGM